MALKNLKVRLYNLILKNGKKNTAEKLVFKSFKKIQKISVLNITSLIKTLEIEHTYFFEYAITEKKRRKKQKEKVKIIKKSSRTNYSIKKVIKTKKFLKENYAEHLKKIFLGLLKENTSNLSNKISVYKTVFLKKKFVNYKWLKI